MKPHNPTIQALKSEIKALKNILERIEERNTEKMLQQFRQLMAPTLASRFLGKQSQIEIMENVLLN
ncbi:CLUMA_CG003737, isoform A [Clunio marinus]|uniref:CLUMA_CG003737, isoform A n=1 Tax=Clunio marinus TaxID=568069 RepID=A0A1J1HR41_9DIPT|nr:CLUMA_CG003737, isoform A [Clunio marinus]